jgi:hypothetical protein
MEPNVKRKVLLWEQERNNALPFGAGSPAIDVSIVSRSLHSSRRTGKPSTRIGQSERRMQAKEGSYFGENFS